MAWGSPRKTGISTCGAATAQRRSEGLGGINHAITPISTEFTCMANTLRLLTEWIGIIGWDITTPSKPLRWRLLSPTNKLWWPPTILLIIRTHETNIKSLLKINIRRSTPLLYEWGLRFQNLCHNTVYRFMVDNKLVIYFIVLISGDRVTSTTKQCWLLWHDQLHPNKLRFPTSSSRLLLSIPQLPAQSVTWPTFWH